MDVHSFNSFPSGHTATAFSLFLITVYLFPNKKVILAGGLYAIICGYSRIYLGQHFPLDIAGGIIAALLSVALSIQIRKKLFKLESQGSWIRDKGKLSQNKIPRWLNREALFVKEIVRWKIETRKRSKILENHDPSL